MKIAIIGTFWLSETFAQAVSRVDDIEVGAICSRSIDKARAFADAHAPGAACYSDPTELATDTAIDAVYIATPNVTHYALSKQMLTAGKHVLCEKPICVHLEEYEELLVIAKAKGLVYLEAMMNAHLPQLKAVQEVLKTAGEVVSARLDFSQRSSKIDRVQQGEVFSTFSKAACGGALMDLGVYSVYMVLQLFGYPKTVDAYSTPICDVDGTDTVILGYDGYQAVLTISKLAESRIRSEVVCKDGTLTLGLLSRLQAVDYYLHGGEKRTIFGTSDFAESMTWEIKDFLSYVNGADYSYMQALSRDSIRLLTEIREKIKYHI
ncbi:MAG: Gfo/Idh/MocA family oxidoreductase [Clostridia bacterium]|nr:Gfo/Idh/MocA family oxidoreductase [Clostridia bacterium]